MKCLIFTFLVQIRCKFTAHFHEGYSKVLLYVDCREYSKQFQMILSILSKFKSYFWIRQYPYNSLTFARHNLLADNFAR